MTFKPRTKVAPSGVQSVDVTSAHTHSSNHRADLFESELCGCFYCLDTFTAESIDDWTDELDGVCVTALCPSCGIDAVIGDASGYPIDDTFLRAMRARWF